MVRAFKRYQALTAVSLALTGSQVHGAPFAYVPNAGSDTVSIINTNRDQVMATIPVGSYPLTVAIHPLRHRVYITDAHGGTVSVINPGRTVATIPVGNLPLGIAVHPDGTRVYVNHFGQQDYSTCTSSCVGYISVIDVRTNQVMDTVQVGRNLYQVAVHPDGSRVYATNNTDEIVHVLDASTLTELRTIPVGGTQPQTIALNADGTRMYVANAASNSVAVIDAVADSFITAIPVGNNPVSLAVSPDGTHVYVPNSGLSYGGGGDVSVIDTATNTVVATIPVGPNPTGVSVTPDGAHVYVSNTGFLLGGGDSVSVIEVPGNTVATTINVGHLPFAYGDFIK
jgi:YVTN family beta-propeller protein